MKKLIFISIVLSLVAVATTSRASTIMPPPPGSGLRPINPPILESPEGENQYPSVSGNIVRSGYTYKYRNDIIGNVEAPSRVELYNASNKYVDVEWGYTDGTKATFEELMGQVPSSEYITDNSSQTIGQTLAMVDEQFTSQQKNTLRGKSMIVSIRFNPSTGRIVDVYFSFLRDSPFVNIPVETYRNIELALKQNFTVTMTAKGKRLRYMMLFWEQEF